MKSTRQAARFLCALILASVIGFMQPGLADGDLREGDRLPGVSGADDALQRGAARMIWFLEALDDRECEDRRIVDTAILKLPRKPGRSPWTEKWTVDRCGELVFYKIRFTPTPDIGGTDFKVSRMDPD